MRAIIQRVRRATLVSGDTKSCEIRYGIVALVGIERGDGERNVARMAERLLTYRIFPDPDGRMNLSLADTGGELLLVPNFTVAADTRKGTRASFTTAAEPAEGERLFTALASQLAGQQARVQTGIFGADMEISLANDGPVTFILEA